MEFSGTWNHDLIRQWAQQYGASPALQPVASDDAEPALGFVFSDVAIEPGTATPISWKAFFARFDMLGLFFIAEQSNGRRPAYRIVSDPSSFFGM